MVGIAQCHYQFNNKVYIKEKRIKLPVLHETNNLTKSTIWLCKFKSSIDIIENENEIITSSKSAISIE